MPAPVLAELDDGAEVVVGGEDGGLDPGFGDALDLHGIGHIGRIVQLDGLIGVGELDLVDHRGGGGDEIQVELAGEAFLNDFKV